MKDDQMKILAIDPGNEQSAYVVYDTETKQPVEFQILDNEVLRDFLTGDLIKYDKLVIEMIASYGMPVGSTIFDTCVWIGRFIECHKQVRRLKFNHQYIYRQEVKAHLCDDKRAKDTNVMWAIIDLYGGDKRAAIGLKKTPGPLYGFKKDIWAAMGVALTAAAKLEGVA